LLLAALVNYAEVVLVQVGIVAFDFDYLRNKPSAWSPFKLHDDVERIPDVGLNSTIGQVNSALEDATGESCETLLG